MNDQLKAQLLHYRKVQRQLAELKQLRKVADNAKNTALVKTIDDEITNLTKGDLPK